MSNTGFERWHYRHIDGIGDGVVVGFADPKRSGEFRLVAGPLPREPAKK